MADEQQETPKRSGIRTPRAIIWKKLKCFARGHGEIGLAGMLERKGHRPLALLQCMECQEFFVKAAEGERRGVRRAG